jgi:hypothetical protein
MPGQRQYPSRHKRLREKLERVVEAGGVACARCGREIVPGEPWDLGHVDGDYRVAFTPDWFWGVNSFQCPSETTSTVPSTDLMAV